MASILVLNGPNLNLLGTREPEVYGHTSLADIDQELKSAAQALGHSVRCFQSNAEHELIEQIHSANQAADNRADFIIFNPAAFTHTSIALRDALLGTGIPFIELHISNVHAREDFRHKSWLSDIAVGVICGLGTFGYQLALQAAHNQLSNTIPNK